MLTWDHKYELGHERIDFEHRIFLSLISDFQMGIEQGFPKTKLIRIIREIAKYADFHFVSEENIMADCNYPELEQHAALHRLLLNQVKDYTYQFSLDEIEALEVFEFLFNWFALHTTSEDRKLVGFVNNG